MLKYITGQLSKLLSVYIVVLIMVLLICTPLLEFDEVGWHKVLGRPCCSFRENKSIIA